MPASWSPKWGSTRCGRRSTIAREEPRTFLSSGGLGTMGSASRRPSARPSGARTRRWCAWRATGSLQMNSQEMATAAVNGVPVKVLVMDNRCLGMVRQWQKLFYRERYSATLLDAVPDFVKLADAYGWRAERVERPEEVVPALERMLAAEGPYLLDVAIDRDQNVYPMVAPEAPFPMPWGPSTWPWAPCAPMRPPRGRVRRAWSARLARRWTPQFGGRWKSDPTTRPPAWEKRAPAGKEAGHEARAFGSGGEQARRALARDRPHLAARLHIESLSVGSHRRRHHVARDRHRARRRRGLRADNKQLHKLISVYKITDLTNDRAIERELALFKVNATPERRSEIIEIANIFRAKIVDVGRGSLTIEATGDEEKLKGLEDLLRAYGIKEIVRTGKIAMSRNSKEG